MDLSGVFSSSLFEFPKIKNKYVRTHKPLPCISQGEDEDGSQTYAPTKRQTKHTGLLIDFMHSTAYMVLLRKKRYFNLNPASMKLFLQPFIFQKASRNTLSAVAEKSLCTAVHRRPITHPPTRPQRQSKACTTSLQARTLWGFGRGSQPSARPSHTTSTGSAAVGDWRREGAGRETLTLTKY